MIEKDVERAVAEKVAKAPGPAHGSPPVSHGEKPGPSPDPEHSTGTRRVSLVKALEFIPRRCRWNKDSPPQFNWPMCFLFAFVSWLWLQAPEPLNQPLRGPRESP